MKQYRLLWPDIEARSSGRLFIALVHYDLAVSSGLINVQTMPPFLSPSIGRARTIENHTYVFTSWRFVAYSLLRNTDKSELPKPSSEQSSYLWRPHAMHRYAIPSLYVILFRCISYTVSSRVRIIVVGLSE